MKILVLSFYYPPDLCAGSFRISAFIDSLRARINADDVIDVVTTEPNRYQSYQTSSESHNEQDSNVRVFRIKIPSHQSGMIDQCKSFAVYFYRAMKVVRREDYDAVYATSSRLFTAFLGMIISKRKKIPLYLDIRDIFLDTLVSIFYHSPKRWFIWPIAGIEKLTMQSAVKINVVSQGFAPYFQKKYPRIPLSFYSNGIDQEFLDFDFSSVKKNERPIITYAGNIGEGQGLDKIIPDIAQICPYLQFVIVGDGGLKNILVDRVKEIENVTLLPPVSRRELLGIYKKSDFLFLHLNDYPAFKKVLPSKIFEYGATGKPIIAGVAGYAREFLLHNLPDSIVFHPGDAADFLDLYSAYIQSEQSEREQFRQEFSRSRIMENLAEDFLQTVQQN